MLWDLVKQGETTYNTTKAQAEKFFGLTPESGGSATASNLTSPTHRQFAKNVSLRLFSAAGAAAEFIFPINPEEFNYTKSERVRITRTLGDPFVDDFGLGTPTLQVRGTTGWHTRPGIDGKDGYAAYRTLHREFHDRYFELRQAQVGSGADPDRIKLWVVNNVDNIVFAVVPMDFHLMRSKSRPLLYQYELKYTIIEDLTQLRSKQVQDALSKAENWQDAFRKRWPVLADIIDISEKLFDSISDGYALLKKTLRPAFQAASVFIAAVGAVLGVIDHGASHVAVIINGVARRVDTVLKAIRPHTMSGPVELAIAIGNLQSVFNELCCYLSEGIKESWLPDFSPIEGVSDCATTRGIVPGIIATSPQTNAVQWVTELNEVSKNTDISGVIGFTQESAIDGIEAPVMLTPSFGLEMNNLLSISQNVTTEADVIRSFDQITTVFGTVTFCPDKVNNTVSEYLTAIPQVKTVVIGENETLQSIALRELGDAGRWREIAAFNGLIVQTPVTILQPLHSFTLDNDLDAGSNSVDYGSAIPTEYIAVGAEVQIRDSNDKQQFLRVKSIEGTVIKFHGSFSRVFTGPIRFTRYVNRADTGLYDYTTRLTADFLTGTRALRLARVKDIYPGYALFLQGNTQSKTYTVQRVDYLAREVTVTAPSIGFSSGAEVQIYDTESRLLNLEPGMTLKIPVTSGARIGTNQSDNEIYGRDIALDKYGFLKVASGDLGIAMGLENLKQAIHHRLLCPYESLIIHPEYGCEIINVIGRKNTPGNIALVRATLVEALNLEPRIKRVKNLQVEATGDLIAARVTVESVDRNTTADLNFVLEGV